MEKASVTIIGGGMAGLSCASALEKAGIDWLLIEAGDRVGGRLKTDEVDGFLLDHGFQVLLTAYPEVEKSQFFKILPFSTFEPGAWIRKSECFSLYSDPIRRPQSILSTLRSPIGNLVDKWNIGRLRAELEFKSIDDIFLSDEKSSYQFLREYGFSESCIHDFFRPFFGGIFLESDLRTSSLQLQFIFKMFSQGSAALPDEGIEMIPRLMLAELDERKILLNSKVVSLDKQKNILELASGKRIQSDIVVLATDQSSAQDLLSAMDNTKGRDVSCYYFSCDEIPEVDPMLYLNADPGNIMHLCFPNLINPLYAPKGKFLLSVSSQSLHDESGFNEMQNELRQWFGRVVDTWTPLRHYFIKNALPESRTLRGKTVKPSRACPFYQCGDYTDNPGLNGAMKSGRLVAEAII